jgi:hypothetical protein
VLTEIVVAIVGPLITAGLTALSILTQERSRRRDQRSRILGDLAYLHEHARAISAYLDARERLGADEVGGDWRRRAAAELDRAYGVVASPAPPADGRGNEEQVPVWREVLLVRPVRGRGANVLRLLYWSSFLWAAWVATGVLIVRNQDPSSLPVVVAGLMFLLLSVAPTLALLTGVRALERRGRAVVEPGEDQTAR